MPWRIVLTKDGSDSGGVFIDTETFTEKNSADLTAALARIGAPSNVIGAARAEFRSTFVKDGVLTQEGSIKINHGAYGLDVIKIPSH